MPLPAMTLPPFCRLRAALVPAVALCLTLVALLAAPVAAQTAPDAAAGTYPAWTDPFVNDFAGVLAPDSAARLRDRLARLKTDTGAEMTIVTLAGIPGGEAGLEAHATGLFNAWGVGDAARNDGVMVLVSPTDRAVRVELGSGYSQDYDLLAQDIVSRVMVPALREARYAEGIEAGSAEIIDRIVTRHAGGLPAEGVAARATDWAKWLVPGGMLAAFAGIVLARRRRRNALPRLCPTCGTELLPGLHGGHSGTGHSGVISSGITCPGCGWRMDRSNRGHSGDRTRSSGGSTGGFGGGRSSGGGASGRF